MIASLQFLPIAMYQFLTILMTSITMTMVRNILHDMAKVAQVGRLTDGYSSLLGPIIAP